MNAAELMEILRRLPAGTPVLLEEDGSSEAAVESNAAVRRMALVEDRVAEGGVPVRRWARAVSAEGELVVVLGRRWPSPGRGGSLDDLVP